MNNIPLIIGFGGISSAGRSSFHHSYKRIIFDALSSTDATQEILALSILMNLVHYTNGHSYSDTVNSKLLASEIEKKFSRHVLANSLVRKISSQDVLCDYKELVQASGQLPTGTNIKALYKSRNHPRNLQMTIYAASDAINSIGIPLDTIKQHISPNQIAVIASSSLPALDYNGLGGIFSCYATNEKISPKQLPLSYSQMPADFINAYMLGSIGFTGSQLGACASFLYNLKQASDLIKSGKSKFVIVGNSDAPIVPEIIEGFRVIGATIQDKDLLKLDCKLDDTSYATASRPFAQNCGFVLSEAAQFIVLCSDDLAVKLGAQVFGAIGEVFINADGYKKSITSPGVGNYITMAQAANFVTQHLGESSLQHNSFVHAHGSSTPQNRVTESHILNEIAQTFKIDKWNICAIKSYLGHSQGTASGDQLMSCLGTWQYGVLPGINTLDAVAPDVHTSNLIFSKDNVELDKTHMDSAILNAKGFGGNNASGVIFSPNVANSLLKQKYSQQELRSFQEEQQTTVVAANQYEADAMKGNHRIIYNFDKNLPLSHEDIQINKKSISIKGWNKKIIFAK